MMVALVALFLSACFPTALIERRSGPTIEARIERSDNEKLYLTTAEGQQYTVDRSDVVDIDHPGNVLLTTGIVIATLGALMLAGSFAVSCSGQGSCEGPGATKLMLLLGGINNLSYGIPLAVSGGIIYSRSVTAAKPSQVSPNTQAMKQSLPRPTCSFCPQ
jgi:hypothetical protein